MNNEVKFITVEMAAFINRKAIMDLSPDEQIGVKDFGLLESALARPQQSVFGEDAYPTIFLKAAALLESLSQNHAFYNANKRTALMSTAMFLRMNGYKLRVDNPKELEDFVVDVVEHKYTLAGTADYLQTHCI